MSGPAAATAAVKRELLVRHLEAWAPAALHRARRATYLHAFADADGGAVAEDALRVLAELTDLMRGRSLSMVVLAADAGAVSGRLGAVQAALSLPAELSVHVVQGHPDDRLAVALKASGARGAPLLAYLDAAAGDPPTVATLAAVSAGRPAELLLSLDPAALGGGPRGGAVDTGAVLGYRGELRDAGFPLVTMVEVVPGAAAAATELLVFGTSSGKSLEGFKDALWSVDEYAGAGYRDPADPNRHLLDISLNPHPGPLRRELLARVAQVGAATVTELRGFTLTDTVFRASDATRVLTALVAAGALTRDPEHGRLGGDVVIRPGTEPPEERPNGADH
ncbi:MAG TPA: hypothetical protein VF755_19550 [Catenuloplanes sp.]|jgi:hypothetical protein